jgi:hypothetical protein
MPRDRFTTLVDSGNIKNLGCLAVLDQIDQCSESISWHWTSTQCTMTNAWRKEETMEIVHFLCTSHEASEPLTVLDCGFMRDDIVRDPVPCQQFGT